MGQTTKPTYANINGLRMYYEIRGHGPQLVLIHGGGSFSETTFSRILPSLAQRYTALAMDLQGHGHAEDVYALMKQVGFKNASVLGFSKGGAVAMCLAARHPEVVDRLIVASIFCRKEGAVAGLWEGFEGATLEVFPQPLKDAYLAEHGNIDGLRTMFELDIHSLIAFPEWSDEDLKGIQAKTLVMSSFWDVVTPEHALYMSRAIPNAELVMLSGFHGEYLRDAPVAGKPSRMPEFTAEIVHEFLSDSK